ncbi:MAG: hypothetical protein HYU62_09745 [Caulobacterales bacterium]|nr:hypothetical protein [Caulobacterales bacterium]
MGPVVARRQRAAASPGFMDACYAVAKGEHVILWEYKPFADGWQDVAPDAVVWVDVAAFDQAWRATEQYVVPGGANGQDDRYARVGRWFAINRHCRMMDATFDEGRVCFIDGRHRFSWLRDQGVEAVPLQVAPNLRDAFNDRFQAKVMATVLGVKANPQTEAGPADRAP